MKLDGVSEAYKITKVHFSSRVQEWATPQVFFDQLNDEFKFTLDSCATQENTKLEDFLSPDDDALGKRWHGIVWCNPPYGRGIGRWIKKAAEEARRGATVVVLVPSRTDTEWWHSYAMQATEIRLVKGRLYFNDGKGRSPFPSALLIFRPAKSRA